MNEYEQMLTEARSDAQKQWQEASYWEWSAPRQKAINAKGRKITLSLSQSHIFGVLALARDGRRFGKVDGIWVEGADVAHAQAAIEKAALEIVECRLAHRAAQQARDNAVEQVAAFARTLGATAEVVYPENSTSRYAYLQKNGQQLKVRAADHGQPTGWVNGKWQHVGGFDDKLGKRHEASDLSIDPETGLTINDAFELVRNTFSAI